MEELALIGGPNCSPQAEVLKSILITDIQIIVQKITGVKM
jgi:hypothetical protein